MSPSKRYAKKQAKASYRRRQKAHERLERDRCQAQRAAEALPQALEALGLPDHLVAEIAGRLQSQQKRLGKIVGGMFPALCGCRTPSELCRVRGWDKNWPSRLLHPLPKRSWLKRLRHLGLEVLVPLWRHVATKSPATQSRWQWTWGIDDAVFHQYGEPLRLVGRWWSGQQHRVLSGLDGLVLVVVVGDGKLVVPGDCALRRPDPVGAGAPCRDTRRWARTMRAQRLAAWGRRGLVLPPPILTGESWFGDCQLMTHVRQQHQGTLLVEGQATDCFPVADGRHVHGADLIEGLWRWRAHPWERGVRDVRLQATSPTYGAVTLVIVDDPGEDRFYLLCLETTLSGPPLIRRRWRRHWIEFVFQVLKPLWATESCQAHSEDAYYGHLVLRLMGRVVLFDTSRVICQGHLTMEERILSLKHYWRFVALEALELQSLSSGSSRQAA
jgi:hypothetical protein